MDVKLLSLATLVAVGLAGCSSTKGCDVRPGLSTNCNQAEEEVVVTPPDEEPDELIVETANEVLGRTRVNINDVSFDEDTQNAYR